VNRGRRFRVPCLAFLFALLCAGPSAAAPTLQSADPATRAKVNGWTEQLRTGWMPNLGQIGGASNVLYTTTAGNAQIFVTTTGISHVFLSSEDSDDPERESDDRERQTELRERKVEWSRLDVKLVGASIRADRARVEDPLRDQGSTNYYLPQCPNGALDVPTYGSITFPEVYPGVDWTVRSLTGGDVHQDFIVRPGADASRIRLEYAGATSIEVADDGTATRTRNLVMRRAMPDDEQKSFAPLETAQPTVLIAGVDSATFEYFGAENDFTAPQWTDSWKWPNRMPEMVRLRVRGIDGPLPEMIVRLNLGEEAGCLENAFQRNCRPRRT
jgi:hypothetical protein